MNCIAEVEYVALKVNGNDITHLSRYEAVQMFLQAKETLVVELCRQKQQQQSAPSGDPAASGSAEQQPPVILTLRTADPAPAPTLPSGSSDKETQTVDQDIVRSIADHFIEQEHHLFEQCLEPEIDIEEITLVRRDDGQSDRMGLVCCNGFFSSHSDDSGDVVKHSPSQSQLISADEEADAEADEDVFISDIQPSSIAERDGRLRRGDQILRINGIDIKSKAEAEAQIAESESGTALTLLVSRLLYADDDEDEDIDSNSEYANNFLPDDYTNVVDKLDKVLLGQVQSLQEQATEAQNPPKSSPPTAAAVHATPAELAIAPKGPSSNYSLQKQKTKDPEHSRTLACPSTHKPSVAKSQTLGLATKNQQQRYDYDESEHIYETIPEDSESEPLYCSPYQSSNYMTAMGSCSSAATGAEAEAEALEMQQQTQRVAQWLGMGVKSQSQALPQPNHRTLAGRPSQVKQQQGRISNRVFSLRSTRTNTSGSSSSGGAGYVDNANVLLGEEVDNSSSAYNTGGSNNSASPRQNLLNPADDEKAMGKSLAQPLMLSPKEPFVTAPGSSMLMLPFGRSGRIGLCSTSDCPGPTKPSIDELQVFESTLLRTDLKLMRLKQLEEPPSQCPQFNAPNLSRYHFVSSQEVANKTQNAAADPKPSSILLNGERGPEEIPMVWKVKRRPDGTRYIVKRPVRNRVSVGLRKSIRHNDVTTTEDDTISEVKIGRYWTKEERKRHIERARERRHQQQQQLQQ